MPPAVLLPLVLAGTGAGIGALASKKNKGSGALKGALVGGGLGLGAGALGLGATAAGQAAGGAAASAPGGGLSAMLSQSGSQIAGGLKGLLGIGEQVSGVGAGAAKAAVDGIPAAVGAIGPGEQAALAAIDPMSIPVGGAAQVVEGGKVAMLDKGALGGFDAASKMGALKGEAEALAAKAEKFQQIRKLLFGDGGQQLPPGSASARGRQVRPKTAPPEVEVVNRKDAELEQLIAMLIGGK